MRNDFFLIHQLIQLALGTYYSKINYCYDVTTSIEDYQIIYECSTFSLLLHSTTIALTVGYFDCEIYEIKVHQ
jgi:hypothetical protein